MNFFFFCCLTSAGARNPDLDKIKKKFLDGVEKFGKSQNSSLKDIRLVIFSQDMYDFFIGKGQEVSQHPSFSKPNKASPPKGIYFMFTIHGCLPALV